MTFIESLRFVGLKKTDKKLNIRNRYPLGWTEHMAIAAAHAMNFLQKIYQLNVSGQFADGYVLAEQAMKILENRHELNVSGKFADGDLVTAADFPLSTLNESFHAAFLCFR